MVRKYREKPPCLYASVMSSPGPLKYQMWRCQIYQMRSTSENLTESTITYTIHCNISGLKLRMICSLNHLTFHPKHQVVQIVLTYFEQTTSHHINLKSNLTMLLFRNWQLNEVTMCSNWKETKTFIAKCFQCMFCWFLLRIINLTWRIIVIFDECIVISRVKVVRVSHYVKI